MSRPVSDEPSCTLIFMIVYTVDPALSVTVDAICGTSYKKTEPDRYSFEKIINFVRFNRN